MRLLANVRNSRQTIENLKSRAEGESGAHLGGVQVLVDQAGNVIINTVS